MSTKETIFALATPYGKSGVAVVRISGNGALPALQALSGVPDWTPNMARLCDIKIDQALAIYFKAPKSFTGEDVVEFHTHGSLAVIRELLERLGAMGGLRPAEPGEFTRRAFLNGKLDLVEAEGLADLIEAETPRQKAQALGQMRGSLSERYTILRTQIITALAHLEAYIDFPDEEIPESVLSGIGIEIDGIKATINAALSDHRQGERLREGIRIVILGAPNAGKSSLLNALSGRDAAIVSHVAGTTRDAIEVHMNIAGFPVILTDTAGLRESSDAIESEGIRRAMARAGEADIKLVLFDGSLDRANSYSKSLVDENTILIISKSDFMKSNNLINEFNNMNYIKISVKENSGIDVLLKQIEQKIATNFNADATPLITRARHRHLLQEALEALNRFSPDKPLELACEELRLAATAVGKITGKIAVDDVLDVIFSQFCIGK